VHGCIVPSLLCCYVSCWHTVQTCSTANRWRAPKQTLSEQALCAACRLRIFRYYLPVFFWCQRQLKQHRAAKGARATPPPLVIGISAPQGSGKSTLVEQLEVLFRSAGSTAVGVSIDDFYLTFQVPDTFQIASKLLRGCLTFFRQSAATAQLELDRG